MFSSLRRRRGLRSHVIGEGVSVEIAFPAVGPSYAVIRDLSSYRLTNFSAVWGLPGRSTPPEQRHRGGHPDGAQGIVGVRCTFIHIL